MTGIVISGHGNFATGLLSAVKLLAGEPEKLMAVDFLVQKSTDDLRKEIQAAVEELGEEVLILTDLKGGSPYNQSVILMTEMVSHKVEVLSGTNLPMLIVGVLERGDKSAEELAKHLLSPGKDGIGRFELNVKPEAEIEDEDGI